MKLCSFVKSAIALHKRRLIEFEEEKRIIRYGGKTFIAYDIVTERDNQFIGNGQLESSWHLTIKAREIADIIRHSRR